MNNRNKACPCGSGKKFKYCCMVTERDGVEIKAMTVSNSHCSHCGVKLTDYEADESILCSDCSRDADNKIENKRSRSTGGRSSALALMFGLAMAQNQGVFRDIKSR